VPESEVAKLRKQLEDSETQRLLTQTRLENLEKQFKNPAEQLRQLTGQKTG
jgi:molecular chaperone GrpE (heat shock protein)